MQALQPCISRYPLLRQPTSNSLRTPHRWRQLLDLDILAQRLDGAELVDLLDLVLQLVLVLLLDDLATAPTLHARAATPVLAADATAARTAAAATANGQHRPLEHAALAAGEDEAWRGRR